MRGASPKRFTRLANLRSSNDAIAGNAHDAGHLQNHGHRLALILIVRFLVIFTVNVIASEGVGI